MVLVYKKIEKGDFIVDKEKVKKFLRDNNKPLIVVVGGLILSVILSSTDVTFLQFLAPLMQIGCVVYAVLFYRAKNKKYEELKKAKEAQLKEEEAAAINDFKNILDATVNNILTVILEEPTTTNFEKGLEHAIKNSAVSLKVEDVLPLAQEILVTRIAKNSDDDVATSILVNYFKEAMKEKLFDTYMPMAIFDESSKEHGIYSNELFNEKKISFVKTLYGFAIRAWNYSNWLHNPADYVLVNNEMLENIVTTNHVIESYCKSNPFEVEEKQKEWIKDIKEVAYQATSTRRLKINLSSNEELLDKLCYCGYFLLCNNDGEELENIAADILEATKTYYEYIRSRT